MIEEEQEYTGRRERMVETQIRRRGVRDPRVLDAMARVPRHVFVPENAREDAYRDGPLPIGGGQTISQPYIVAFMTEQLRLKGNERVLEIGAGSGYQTAVLALLAQWVYAIEYLGELAETARRNLEKLQIRNASLRTGDGRLGWPGEAPFDAILVAATSESLPRALVDQLAPRGRMILPLLKDGQFLTLVEKDEDGGCRQETLMEVRFVPLV